MMTTPSPVYIASILKSLSSSRAIYIVLSGVVLPLVDTTAFAFAFPFRCKLRSPHHDRTFVQLSSRRPNWRASSSDSVSGSTLVGDPTFGAMWSPRLCGCVGSLSLHCTSNLMCIP